MSRPDPRPAAVIVGLDCITGLQSARLLAERNISVIGVAADRLHFCALTRAASRVIQAPTSGEPLVRALERLALHLPAGRSFLLPCTDAAVLTISEARERLGERYAFVLPGHDIVTALMDKVNFTEYASQQGLPIPPTSIIRSRSDAECAATLLDFPAVVKPAIKTPRWIQSTRAKAFTAGDGQELLDIYDRTNSWTDLLIAQSWIEGGEDALISCNAYFGRDGRPLATFVARKVRQWPPDTGTSSLGVEVREDTVLELSNELFTSAGYSGLAYVEVKRDARTGNFAIIEPNLGRPTGRSAIAERGGVELLLTAYCDALGLPLPRRREQLYRGAKWIYWRHDLQAAIVRHRRGELSIGEWLDSVRGPAIEAVGSLRDPLPFIADWLQAVRQAAGALARRSLRRNRSGDQQTTDND
jgi:D-aspartate ligase